MGIASAIGGALSLGGAIIGSKSSNKAASKAANVSAENNAANVALQRDIHNQNRTALSPFMQRGNAAGDAINALLGIGGAPAQTALQAQPNALSQFYPRGAAERPPLTNESRFPVGAGYGIADGQAGLGTPYSTTQTPQTSQGNPLASQNAAFDNFRNSTGYQFRLNEGMDALNSGYAGAGVLQSGDALRAAQEYGQNFASNEFGNYINLLTNQQGVGLSGANALAGVGTNYANNVTAQNTQNAANQANALLSRQNTFANTLGTLGGGLFNYGLGKIL